jgi:phytoene dehydrogenase-like protein
LFTKYSLHALVDNWKGDWVCINIDAAYNQTAQALRSSFAPSGDMMSETFAPISRRRLLSLIGAAAGSATMYQATASLGLASESHYKGPIKLSGDPKGASVLILGAGLAGLVAAL